MSHQEKLNVVFKSLWLDYSSLNPQAPRIHQLLEARDETVLNDHVAFRTFDIASINLQKMAQHFEALGYVEKDTYHFKAKKLRAKHYEHPDSDQAKIFISELLTSELSAEAQKSIHQLADQISSDFSENSDFLFCGRPWSVDSETYEKLTSESEYAGWMAAFGFRANHFTVSLNSLTSFQELAELNSFLKAQGFALNTSGGEVKGSPSEYLEQSSTLAAEVDVNFSDGTLKIPSCYYEFAKRYPLPNGNLFQGFVTQSADKIFESTDRQKQTS